MSTHSSSESKIREGWVENMDRFYSEISALVKQKTLFIVVETKNKELLWIYRPFGELSSFSAKLEIVFKNTQNTS